MDIHHKSAFRIALTYLLVAALWILWSDQAVDAMFNDHQAQRVAQTLKGWLFVVVTAGMLYLLVNKALHKLNNEALVQQRLSHSLAEIEEIQRHLLASLDDVVWMLDIASGKLLFISAAVERIYGITPEDFIAKPDYWWRTIHPDDRAVLDHKKSEMDSHGYAEVEYRIVRTDGGVRWLRDRTRVLYGADGNAVSMVGIATDVTATYRHAEHIHRLSNYDNLTGLPNRLMLEGLLHEAISTAKASDQRLAVICFDISRLKDINDTFGHNAGDTILTKFASRTKQIVGAGDIVARLGADEFAVALPALSDGQQARDMAQKILNRLDVPFKLHNEEVKVRASVGISLFPDDADSPQLLLRHADLALHESKLQGVGNISFYEPRMETVVEDRVMLVSDLHHALDRGELALFYQPQVRLSDGAVVGMEALIRWRHPLRGMIPPSRFIPLAEESGLIHSIGAWVLQEACRQNYQWQQMGLPSVVVAVNVSAWQFRDPMLYATVESTLAETKLDARYLELEVTESVIMDGAERMVSLLNKLHGLGVQLSIDDFGTGYSSLAYLTRFAVNKLKIDQAFVRGALNDARDAAIVSTIIQMAKGLSMTVIAEGVETPAQAQMLGEHQCDEVQGYLYSMPLPASEMEAYLRSASNPVS